MVKIRTLIAFGLLGLGCGTAGDAPPTGQDQAAVTYRHDAAPLLARYCESCHSPGGIGPITLNSYASAKAAAAAIRGAVMSESMPPWMPSDKSAPIRNSRAMRPEDRALLLRWVESGASEGDASEQPRTDIPAADPAPAAPRADLTVDPGFTYQPKVGRPDDYRCFLVDPKLPSDAWITGGAVLPDNKAIVHHVLLFEITAADAAAVRKKDGADGTPGYTCFGGPGVGQPQTLFGWAPGGVPMRTPEGTAIKLGAGSLLAMQVHYNLQSYTGVGDRTKVIVELGAQAPQRLFYNIPIANPRNLKIPAGDPAAKQTIVVPFSAVQQFLKLPAGDMLIHGNAPHMHLLGTRISTLLIGGPVLVDIPRWDFHWQQAFSFKEPVRIKPDDVLSIECTYDNSATNQPVVNGQQQAPREVTWGEGTNDEMCLSYLGLTSAN